MLRAMKNAEVAKVFQAIADLLELKGENPFKIRAYQRAVFSLEHLPQEVAELVAEGRLREVPGVGEAIAKKITEFVTTGRLQYYEELKAEFPEGMSTLLEVPGIGPKTAMRLGNELDIKSLDELEEAINEGRVAALPRLGEKTVENIRRHIQALRRKDRRIPIGEALSVVDEIMAGLKGVPGLKNLTPAGSLRRFRETIGDIDLMGTADDAPTVIQAFVSLPQVREILAKGTTKASVVMAGGLQVDFRIVEHDSFGSLLQHFTGSMQHNVNLRERAHRMGLKLSEYGITDLATGKLEKFTSEADFYRRQGLQFMPPEIREGQQEIALAEAGNIPMLVELADIKGDLHVHTDWSDGRDSLEAMAQAAKAKGYQYLAISDHSAGRGIAHGLDNNRLRQQIELIRELNQKIKGIHIFSGMEVDIRADGSLDMSEELLGELDIVIAAVHSGMGQSEARMTERLIRAMESPHVDILAHPTCRLLQAREPVAADMEAVFQAALRTNTALEINAMPSRLDLKDTHVYRARELGVKLVISTDAHAGEHLDFMRFGIGVARRGWCRAADVLNTLPRAALAAYFEH
ncbi:MAG: DNA polymerase/3'-5' exonuclease PolX [Dehalococcoidales bacterium]|nr:DNA polymerase/3'-5' exonuclease PolX [Dehalococcoidales bacterium]